MQDIRRLPTQQFILKGGLSLSVFEVSTKGTAMNSLRVGRESSKRMTEDKLKRNPLEIKT